MPIINAPFAEKHKIEEFTSINIDVNLPISNAKSHGGK